MPSLGWKHYATLFAAVSGTPVFCYWYYSLPTVVDRYTEQWMIDLPKKENIEFREFMKELSEKKLQKEHEELIKKATIEKQKRAL